MASYAKSHGFDYDESGPSSQMPLPKQDSLADGLIMLTNDGKFAIAILRVEETISDPLQYTEEKLGALREVLLAFNTSDTALEEADETSGSVLSSGPIHGGLKHYFKSRRTRSRDLFSLSFLSLSRYIEL